MKKRKKKKRGYTFTWTGGNMVQYYVTSIENANKSHIIDKMRLPEGFSTRGKVLFKKNAIKKFNWKITQIVNACCMLYVSSGADREGGENWLAGQPSPFGEAKLEK